MLRWRSAPVAALASDPLLYLDACAAVPPDPGVLARMLEHQQRCWANPSSVHPAGIAAAELLERSRQTLLDLMGCPTGQVIFTSGGTEADNLALLGTAGTLSPGRLLLSPLEHPAVSAAAQRLRQQGWEVVTLAVDSSGLIDLAQLEPLLQPPTKLVSIAWASSDLGTLQPMERIGELCRAAGVVLHSDAVQVLGQLPLMRLQPLPVDLLSLSAHKFQGPRGIGALVLREPRPLQAQVVGGGQEGGLRSGTESPWLASALVDALQLREQQQPALEQHLRALRQGLQQELLHRSGLQLSGAKEEGQRLPHHLSVLLATADGVPRSGRAAVRALARHGLAVSSGSACSSGRDQASQALLALGLDDRWARSGLRLSLGPWHTSSALAGVADLLESVLPTLPPAACP